jgi:hypothetical protein
MSLRMVPIRNTFQKMARLVRDLGVQQGKDIQLVLEGEDTELDRNIVEELGDPLVHMIRNSADHGIESQADRLAEGKPAAGTITLQCSQDGCTYYNFPAGAITYAATGIQAAVNVEGLVFIRYQITATSGTVEYMLTVSGVANV